VEDVMSSDSSRGQFVWFDLMTSDPEAAVSFYTDLVGWGTQPWEGGDQPYTMWTNGEQPLGGVMEILVEAGQAGAPPNWMAYVAVSDVDAVADRAKELGGSVMHPPTDVPGAGRFAVLADPQGAVFAVYTSKDESPSPAGPPKSGEFSWHELATTDYQGAYEFYADLFGWEKQEAMEMGEGWIYQIYGRAGTPLGGMFNKTAEMPGPPMWLYYIKVDSVEAAVERVRQLGGQVLNGPMDVPGGDQIAQCMDPQGAVFALHSSAG
jgi:predicted enzyme related to lactoylglutathione lyase